MRFFFWRKVFSKQDSLAMLYKNVGIITWIIAESRSKDMAILSPVSSVDIGNVRSTLFTFFWLLEFTFHSKQTTGLPILTLQIQVKFRGKTVYSIIVWVERFPNICITKVRMSVNNTNDISWGFCKRSVDQVSSIRAFVMIDFFYPDVNL